MRLVLCISILWSSKLIAQSSVSTSYQLKAVFLFNFTQFVEWPTASFTDSQAPLVIGVLGVDPFGKLLEEAVHGEKVNGHPLVVQRYRSLEEVKICHILFVNLPKTNEVQDVLNSLQGKSVLIVGDTPNFALKGGMIQFFTEENKIRLQVNLEATKAANLTISSKLLRLAKIIVSPK